MCGSNVARLAGIASCTADEAPSDCTCGGACKGSGLWMVGCTHHAWRDAEASRMPQHHGTSECLCPASQHLHKCAGRLINHTSSILPGTLMAAEWDGKLYDSCVSSGS